MYMCRHTSMDRWRPIVLLHYWRGGGGGYVGKDGYEAPLHSYSYYGEWRRTPHHLRYTAYTT